MLKKSLMLYFFLLSPLLASSENKDKKIDLAEIFSSSAPVRILYIPRQETGEELIARNMHKPELWSCSDWLKQERPNFSEETLSSHPLFSAVKEAMALADFEVDVLTGFTISVYSPDVQKIISKLDEGEQQNVQDTIFKLRENALRAKYFTAHVIDMAEGKIEIDGALREFFLSKMIAQIHEVAKLKHTCMMLQSKRNFPSQQKKQVVFLASDGKRTILSPQDPDSIASALKNAFLRSLNSKLRIMRIFLDDLRSKGKISKDLSDILLLSSSLHPFLNHENDDWVDLDRGEVNDFLGNAAVLGIDLKKLFTKERIQGVSVPNRYTKLSQFSIPKFLLGTSDHPSNVKKKKKKKKKKATLTSTNTSAHSSSNVSVTSSASSSTSASESSSSSSLGSSSAHSSSSVSVTSSAPSSTSASESTSSCSLKSSSAHSSSSVSITSSTSSSTSASESSSSSSLESSSAHSSSSVSVTSSTPSSTSALGSSSSSSLESTSTHPFQKQKLPKSSVQDEDGEKKTFTAKTDVRRTDSHADTIYDIFRPHGYKGLNSDKIIAAWEHVTEERGFLKKKTGSSHQPLCVVLSDGTRVIMPFFISDSYGPNYMKHVRDAFEAIGYGKDWLRGLRYKI